MGSFASEGEVCRCVLQSARIFEQTLRSGILQQRAISAGFDDLGDGQATATSGSEVVGDRPVGTSGGRSFFAFTKVKSILNTLPFRRLEDVAKR